MKRITTIAAFIFTAFLLTTPVDAGGKVMITSVVTNFVLTGGNVGCPKSAGGAAFVVDLEKYSGRLGTRKMERLYALIQEFERQHGVQVTSKTTVKDAVTAADVVRTRATGPYAGAGKALCELLRDAL